VKIFGIGLSKTGTTSLAEALTILGYPTKDNPGLSRYVKDDLSSIDARVLDEHVALTDTRFRASTASSTPGTRMPSSS